MLPSPVPAPTAADAAIELALLQQQVESLPLPLPVLPGWESLAAAEYARAVLELRSVLADAAAALAAARAAA